MKGPKAIGSFLVLILPANKITEIMAPNIKDKRIFSKDSLAPKTNPKAPIRVTSPSPIPPLEIRTIAKKMPPARNNPKRLANIFAGIWYII